jgi:hypothetical protein
MAVDRDARAALEDYAGLDATQAGSLLDAVLAAAELETLEVLAGDAPAPSSLADARALRLRYLTEKAKRALKPREVEVILRVAPSVALSTLRRINATYPRVVDEYRRKGRPRDKHDHEDRRPAIRVPIHDLLRRTERTRVCVSTAPEEGVWGAEM